jgi:glycosyltransferase involved in cell wall biosynthesis
VSGPIIAHLTSVHPLYDVRIFHKECKSLARAGYDVVLIGTGKAPEQTPGIQFRMIRTPPNRFVRITLTAWQVYRAASSVEGEVYHFHDPELIPVGLLLKLRGKRVIYDVHENVPGQMMSKDYLPMAVRGLIGKVAALAESLGARVFDRIVAARQDVATRFPATKTLVVQNYAAMDQQAASDSQPYSERPPTITYLGGITRIRGAHEMVRSMSLLPGESGARLALVGQLDDELGRELMSLPGWDRVDALGFLGREEAAQVLGRSRAGLVLLHPAPNHMAAQPTKIFEYMAAGLPVIASDFPLWRQFLEPLDCVLLVNPLDPVAIAGAVNWLLQHPAEAEEMGRRGAGLVRSRFSWDKEAEILIQMYEELLGKAPDPPEEVLA